MEKNWISLENRYNDAMQITKNSPQEFITRHKTFLWWVKDVSVLHDDTILEATLTHGTMEDKKELLAIMGRSHFSEVFDKIISTRRRQNLEPRTVAYWSHYLSH